MLRVPKPDQFIGNSPRADHAAKRGQEFVALLPKGKILIKRMCTVLIAGSQTALDIFSFAGLYVGSVS